MGVTLVGTSCRSAARRRWLALIAVAAATSAAHADVTIDWAAGTVNARGVGIANRLSPSPAAARGPARRMAEDAARKQLAAGIDKVPLAGGGTLGRKLGDIAIKERVDRAVASALVIDATPETDGSWTVTMGVPLEALRQAVADGPRAHAASDTGPPVIVVEGVAAAPALGVTVDKLAVATLWVKDVPPWASGAPRVKATSAKDGAIVTPGTKATASTLVVLVR